MGTLGLELVTVQLADVGEYRQAYRLGCFRII